MGATAIHNWFRSTADRAMTSHNGSGDPVSRKGSIGAFQIAYARGYRWFQVDATPIRDELLSCHTIFGCRPGYLSKTRDQVPEHPPLYDLLTHPSLVGARWNIELKTKRGLPQLASLLTRLRADGWNLDRVMISSPWRPSVLRAVGADFAEVALAAPVVHGGVFGVRFLGARRARPTAEREFDCQQCHHLFVRRRRRTIGRPVRQAWTVRRGRVLDRVLDTGAHPIVASGALAIPRRQMLDAAGPTPAGHQHNSARPDDDLPAADHPGIEALALGGGGWRGAFGAIGAVMYLVQTGRWDRIRDVVGISGGSFAVAALARPAGESAGDEPGDEPEAAMRWLYGSLVGAGRRAVSAVGFVAMFVIALVMATVLTVLISWSDHKLVATLLTVFVVAFASVMMRVVIASRFRSIVRNVFHNESMRTTTGDRRYAIGATGLDDGQLYSFTSDPETDARRWLAHAGPEELAVPLGGAPLWKAVHRSTSLPGLGQLSTRMMVVPSRPRFPGDTNTSIRVPDRLVDGGISGIFGRGLIRVDRPPVARVTAGDRRQPEPVGVLVVDAGRRLVATTGKQWRHRTQRWLERLSVVYHLARWLQIAFDTAYRHELAHVRDGQQADGCVFRLVRLAEREEQPDRRSVTARSERRRGDLDRLTALRDEVHQLSLLGVTRVTASQATAVAIAACALEFDDEPDIVGLLGSIGERLGRGSDLSDAWQAVRIPLLGDPVELGPPEMRRPEDVDQPSGDEYVAVGRDLIIKHVRKEGETGVDRPVRGEAVPGHRARVGRETLAQ